MARPKDQPPPLALPISRAIALLERAGVEVTPVHRAFGLSPSSRLRLAARIGAVELERVRRELDEESDPEKGGPS